MKKEKHMVDIRNTCKIISLLMIGFLIASCSRIDRDSASQLSSSSSLDSSAETSSSNEPSSSEHVHIPGEPVKENFINPTCIEEGSYDLVTYCVDDNVEISREHITVSALGHDYIEHNGQEATCTENGYAPYVTCSRCDYSTYQQIDATGHIHLSDRKENIIEATCTEEGSYDLVTYCLDDNVEISRESITLEALGHEYSDWQTIKESTDYQDGLRTKECARCHDVVEEILPSTSPFTFVLSSDGKSYSVSGYEPEDGYQGEDIVIPETFNDLPVNLLSLSITKSVPTEDHVRVIVPKSITRFSEVRVYFSDNLEEYQNFNNPIDILYKGTLEDFLNIERVNVMSSKYPHYLYIFDEGISDFVYVNKVVLPEGLEEINTHQFDSFQFEELVCPSSLKTIGALAFSFNFTLRKVNLNEGLITINGGAFNNTGIEEITIPGTVIDTSLSNSWFYGCSNLLSITIKEGAQLESTRIGHDRTVKVLDYTNKGMTNGNEDILIKLDNMDSCDLFTYQDFVFEKYFDDFYLILYKGQDINVTLPDEIIYQEQTVHSYTVWRYAFYCLSNKNIPINDAVKYKIGTEGIPIKKMTFTTNINYFASGICNQYLEEVYFDGAFDDLETILKKSPIDTNGYSLLLSKHFFGSNKSANNIIHYRDNDGIYAECDLSTLNLK